VALARYVVTNTTTVAAGSFTLDSGAGLRDGTGSWAGAAGAWAEGFGVTFVKGQSIMLDNAAGGGQALYTAIGAGNLRAYVQGSDDVGHGGLGN
jgi:hypothetical protein